MDMKTRHARILTATQPGNRQGRATAFVSAAR